MALSIRDVIDDLVTSNEIGTGEREYYEADGKLFVQTWDDEDDPYRETGTYRVGFVIEAA